MNTQDTRTFRFGNTSSQDTYQKFTRRKALVLIFLVALVLLLALGSICLGSSSLSIGDTILALLGQGDSYNTTVVFNLRLPRVLTAVIGGFALALAGCAFQSVLRNPLASASTLGISQAAAFGAALAIIVLGFGTSAAAYEGVFTSNPYIVIICAFAASMVSTLAILALSRVRNMSTESIVLAGVALSALFAGATAVIQYFAQDTQVAAVVFWTFGDLGRVSYAELPIIAAITAAGFIFIYFNRWNYNAMETGEDLAHSLGLGVRKTRLLNMLVGSLLASSIIGFCGTINFIGLIAPHIMRRFIGNDYRYLVVASALAGSFILLISDMLARLICAPAVLPISAITSFVGVPIFLYLLLRGTRK